MFKRGALLGLVQQFTLAAIIVLIAFGLGMFGGSHINHLTHQTVNNFFNPDTLLQVATDTSFFAIMAVGATIVIISGGIDLSVGSVYCLSGVVASLVFRHHPYANPLLYIGICCGVGVLAGLLNGCMIAAFDIHPFVVTLGTMWAFRGLAFVITNGESITVPGNMMNVAKSSLGLGGGLHPAPLLVMVTVALLGHLFLNFTAWGRRIFAVGGNVMASRYAGLRVPSILIGIYMLAGLTAGIAGALGSSYYGASSSADGQGYELYVIAASVVGGVSLLGGRGSAFGAFLGAVLIVMIRQSIETLNLNENYEYIIVGVAIIIAVVIDRLSAKALERRALATRGAAFEQGGTTST